ncbi:hypothetical protein BS47DRAFT_378947 [Hydnum rufescens UP504]|uniref:F-box domain-containing protein n=1 Tax=Hydnum rufescens UP504 TaxID=1448309 RepID=A0A9P6AJ63_9AGAM|nr:hypothetical protein BS47DRAFT_378947 [Hydnum rufescens UP504]
MSDGRRGTQRLLTLIRDSLDALSPLMKEDRGRITPGHIPDIATSSRLRRDPAIIHELERFDADLKIMDEIDAALHTLRRRLLAHNHEYRTQLAPISLLPVEILCSIFVHVMTSEIGSPGFVRDTPKYVASITHVCRRWRTIALEQAQLWTHINANWPPDQIATWLSRGTLPLCATYVPTGIRRAHHGIPNDIPLTTEDRIRVMISLVSHSHRWSAAKLCFNPSAVIDVRAFPRLHSLELFRARIKNLVTLCPQLVRLVVGHTPHLELEEWAAVLPSCNVLEYLEIGWLGPDESPRAAAHPVPQYF